MKKIILLVIVLVNIVSVTFASATKFNQPIYLGWYANTRGGGPSPAIAKGYDYKTNDSFTFGRGAEALTFKFENHYYNGKAGASHTKGVYIGKNFLLKNIIACPEIYKITDNHGRIFYLSKGTTSGPSQVFLLMGKCANSYYNYIGISNLQNYCTDIEFMDHTGAPHLGEITIQDNRIILPYTRSYSKNNSYIAGKFIFEWDDNVQWFGIKHVAY